MPANLTGLERKVGDPKCGFLKQGFTIVVNVAFKQRMLHQN